MVMTMAMIDVSISSIRSGNPWRGCGGGVALGYLACHRFARAAANFPKDNLRETCSRQGKIKLNQIKFAELKSELKSKSKLKGFPQNQIKPEVFVN
jgi:hypothetical protein